MAGDYLQYPKRMPNPSADAFLSGGGEYMPYSPSAPPTASEGFDWKAALLGTGAGGIMGGPVGAGLALAGTALQGYGQYRQMQEARKQYRQAVRAWEAEQERQRKEASDRQRQTFLGNALTYGNYAGNLLRDAADRYGSYATKYGLTG